MCIVNSPNQIREIRLFRVNNFDFIMFASEMGNESVVWRVIAIGVLLLWAESLGGDYGHTWFGDRKSVGGCVNKMQRAEGKKIKT